MVRCSGRYLGNLRVETLHEESGVMLITDAPKDIQGQGESFSPTDLFAVSLATCILTTIAVVAERENVSLIGTSYIVEKHMSSQPPRKISDIKIKFTMPASIPEEFKRKIEKYVHACPVHRSIDSEVNTVVDILYV